MHDALTILYISSCIAVSITYVWNLIWFMQLLAPEGIIRLDPDKIAKADLDHCSAHQAECRLIELYRGIINEDLVKLHDRCDRFVKGLRYVLLTLSYPSSAMVCRYCSRYFSSGAQSSC